MKIKHFVKPTEAIKIKENFCKIQNVLPTNGHEGNVDVIYRTNSF